MQALAGLLLASKTALIVMGVFDLDTAGLPLPQQPAREDT